MKVSVKLVPNNYPNLCLVQGHLNSVFLCSCVKYHDTEISRVDNAIFASSMFISFEFDKKMLLPHMYADEALRISSIFVQQNRQPVDNCPPWAMRWSPSSPTPTTTPAPAPTSATTSTPTPTTASVPAPAPAQTPTPANQHRNRNLVQRLSRNLHIRIQPGLCFEWTDVFKRMWISKH